MYLLGWDTNKMKYGAFNEQTREYDRYFESVEQARPAINRINRESSNGIQ